jgi:glucose/arabinose dehydrogenase
MNVRPPNGAGQTPAFAGQTRAPEQKLNVPFTVVTVTEGLVNPWGLAFLPDGRMLVTERPGRLRVVSADGKQMSEPVTGLPAVDANGQGGLLGIAIDPAFPQNGQIYWSYAEPGANGNNTAVARGRLVHGAAPKVENVQVIFSQRPSLASRAHFGGRLVFGRDGTLFITLGDRSITEGRMQSQRLDGLLGKIARINATARFRATTRLSARRVCVRRSGRSGIATFRQPRSTPRRVSCGRPSTAPAAAMR